MTILSGIRGGATRRGDTGLASRNLLAFRAGGCSTFDFFGAGQVVSHHTFGGTSWRDAPETSALMFDTFPVARALHEVLWCGAVRCIAATVLLDTIIRPTHW